MGSTPSLYGRHSARASDAQPFHVLSGRDYARQFALSYLDGRPTSYGEWPVVRRLHGEVVSGLDLLVRRRDTGKEWVTSYDAFPIRDAGGRLT